MLHLLFWKQHDTLCTTLFQPLVLLAHIFSCFSIISYIKYTRLSSSLQRERQINSEEALTGSSYNELSAVLCLCYFISFTAIHQGKKLKLMTTGSRNWNTKPEFLIYTHNRRLSLCSQQFSWFDYKTQWIFCPRWWAKTQHTDILW